MAMLPMWMSPSRATLIGAAPAGQSGNSTAVLRTIGSASASSRPPTATPVTRTGIASASAQRAARLTLVRLFQLSARCCAVRHARAWAVSVGFLDPLVPITEPPTIPRLWTSWQKPHLSTTLVSGSSPMRAPP